MEFSKKSSFLIIVSVAVLAMAGCDALLPKPKKAAKPAAQEAPAAQPAAKTAAPDDEVLPKDVLAKVGDWTLSMEDFKKRLEAIKQVVKDFDPKSEEAKGTVLDELIRQQLLVYEAKQQKIENTDEIKAAVKDFENTLLVQDIASRLTKDVKATEQEAQEYYNAHPDLFVSPVQKSLREIVVPSQAEAKDLLVQILQGADFAQVAKEKSKAKSAEKGGDLGFVEQAPFEAMQKAIESLKKGDVPVTFEGPDGYYIVKVEDVQGGQKKSFDDIKEELVRLMTMQKQQQVVMEKLNEISKKVKVQVNAGLLKE